MDAWLNSPRHPEERDREQAGSAGGQGKSSLGEETSTVLVRESSVSLVLKVGDDDTDCDESSVRNERQRRGVLTDHTESNSTAKRVSRRTRIGEGSRRLSSHEGKTSNSR